MGKRAVAGEGRETKSREDVFSAAARVKMGLGAEQRLDVLAAGRLRSEKRNLRRRRAEPVRLYHTTGARSWRRRELLFSVPSEIRKKKASTTKKQRASTQAEKRRDACTTARGGDGCRKREGDASWTSFASPKDARPGLEPPRTPGRLRANLTEERETCRSSSQRQNRTTASSRTESPSERRRRRLARPVSFAPPVSPRNPPIVSRLTLS